MSCTVSIDGNQRKGAGLGGRIDGDDDSLLITMVINYEDEVSV